MKVKQLAVSSWQLAMCSWRYQNGLKRHLFMLFLMVSFSLHSQDLIQAHKIVDSLTSTYFWGRGYTNNGMNKAADFIEAELKSYGVKPMRGSNYQQEFFYAVNTFPGKMDVVVDGKPLKPGVDFIIGPESSGRKAKGNLLLHDSIHFIDVKSKIEVTLRDKLTWSVATEAINYTRVEILKKRLTSPPQKIEVNIENRFQPNFKSSNVGGIIKGTEKPDSLIIITAHYDHLGGMGSKTYFPGANDNAGGVALLLELAKYYSQHPAKYSIAFIAFGGEEAGLVGSKFFVDNPLVPLKNIRFLINLDLVGTGNEGATVVNASLYKMEFNLLNEINTQHQYLTKLKSRGKAANSDHYWFTEKGVPSFFIYAMGGIQAYHDVFDNGETLPLTEFEDLFRLIVAFNDRLMANQH